ADRGQTLFDGLVGTRRFHVRLLAVDDAGADKQADGKQGQRADDHGKLAYEVLVGFADVTTNCIYPGILSAAGKLPAQPLNTCSCRQWRQSPTNRSSIACQENTDKVGKLRRDVTRQTVPPVPSVMLHPCQ